MLDTPTKFLKNGLSACQIFRVATDKPQQFAFLRGSDAAAHRTLHVSRPRCCNACAYLPLLGGADGAHVNHQLLDHGPA